MDSKKVNVIKCAGKSSEWICHNILNKYLFLRIQYVIMLGFCLDQNTYVKRNKIHFNTTTLALAFHVGPISTNGYSRPNLKVQKKQVSYMKNCHY